MGTDILPGHTYTDGQLVNGPSLTEHVSEATIKPTFYSSKTAKDPVVLTDEFLVRDTVADSYRKVTLATLRALLVGAGSVIQTSYAEYTANSNLTAVIPEDDTIPQNTEGTQIISLSITPQFVTSRINLSFAGCMSPTLSPGFCAAIFRDSIANAIASILHWPPSGTNFTQCVNMLYQDTPSTTSAITYAVRAGPAVAGTIRMNGYTNARAHGGIMRTVLIAQEIKQ